MEKVSKDYSTDCRALTLSVVPVQLLTKDGLRLSRPAGLSQKVGGVGFTHGPAGELRPCRLGPDQNFLRPAQVNERHLRENFSDKLGRDGRSQLFGRSDHPLSFLQRFPEPAIEV